MGNEPADMSDGSRELDSEGKFSRLPTDYRKLLQLFDLNDPPEITIDKERQSGSLRMEMGVNEQAREEQSSFITYSIRLRSTKVKESRGKGSLGAHTTLHTRWEM
ncbi:hypothetical protein KQX54_019827 [Cotesia glomerata]|uniref:Uncharacterized protein n=1 Tax=Cotesia glomerata TaxID=32391 RepID=A0AAV7HWX7_COTGL|nr:hypothetical protein KQX54_019827 [Cotesia glomerata]